MLVIICWNIEKLTEDTARRFGEYVMSVVGRHSVPVIAFILENKTKPEQVIAHFRSSSQGNSFEYAYLDLGGSTHRRENIIVAYRGLEVTSLECYEDWGSEWSQSTQTKFGEELQKELGIYQLQLQRSRRNPPVLRTPPPYPEPDSFRNPVLVRLRLGLHEYAIVAMHAPGPKDGSKDWAKREYTKLYMQAVLSTLPEWVGVVVGDMNLYGSTPENTGFSDLSRRIGGTTLSESLERTSSRLDRVLARPKVSGGIELFEPFSGERDTSTRFSDHFGVGFSVQWMPDIPSILGSSLIPWTLAESEREYDEMLWESTQLERALGSTGKELGERLRQDAEQVVREVEAWMKRWLETQGIELSWKVQYRTCDYLSFSYGDAITLPEGWSLGQASGAENNCLIDTLVQLVAPHVDSQARSGFVPWIRTRLNTLYGVPLEGFLMAGVHSLPILEIIGTAIHGFDAHAYTVHALAVINGVQIEETTGNGGTDLFLFCNGSHYDPIFQS